MAPDDTTTRPTGELVTTRFTNASTEWFHQDAAPPWMFDAPARPATGRARRRLMLGSVAAGLCLVSAVAGGLVEASIARDGTGAAPAAAAVAARVGATALTDTVKRTAAPLNGVASVVAAVAPSVVTIETQGAGFGRRSRGGATGVGSGFVVGSDGWILTCDHVVASSDAITVTFSNGRTFDAVVAAEDAGLDLAVLKIDARGLPSVTLGSSASIVLGQEAIVIGSPLGDYPGSVSDGIVSGLERTITVQSYVYGGGNTFQHLIQTDAAINPGNSGGPLLDAAGTVVGIVSAESGEAQGIGFAIPVDRATSLLDRTGV